MVLTISRDSSLFFSHKVLLFYIGELLNSNRKFKAVCLKVLYYFKQYSA